MTWGRLRASRFAAPERVPWYSIAATAVVFLVLVVASASSWAGVTMAHVNSSLYLEYNVELVGTTSQDVLTDNGSVVVWLNFSVENPSPKILYFDSVTYKVWVEDPGSPSGYFLALFNSLDVPSKVVPPWGNTTLSLRQTLSHTIDPSRFAAVRAIQQAEANRTGSAAGLAWSAYALLSLPIDGVPPAAPTAGSYQFNVNRVILSWGNDHGS